jgi:hypothetical protein
LRKPSTSGSQDQTCGRTASGATDQPWLGRSMHGQCSCMSLSARKVDTVVIGSGIGGLAAGAALAKCGRRVLVLERDFQLGGLTQTFHRGEYTFGTGLHYIGGVGEGPQPENQFGRMLRWLTEGRLRFSSLGSPYDIVQLPGFEFPVEAPRAAYIGRLKAAFPEETGVIDQYFAACDDAQRASRALSSLLSFPPGPRISSCLLTKSSDRPNEGMPMRSTPSGSCTRTVVARLMTTGRRRSGTARPPFRGRRGRRPTLGRCTRMGGGCRRTTGWRWSGIARRPRRGMHWVVEILRGCLKSDLAGYAGRLPAPPHFSEGGRIAPSQASDPRYWRPDRPASGNWPANLPKKSSTSSRRLPPG